VELKEIKQIFNIPFTESMIQGAREKAKALGSINNSILRGAGNTAGYLGEEAVSAYIGAEIISCSEGNAKYNHDLYLDGKKIEIKTKRRTVVPKDFYDVSVAETSKHQRPDLYIFLSLEFDRVEGKGRNKVYYGLENIWVCGQMEADRYFDKATLWEAGRVDTSNNFKTHVNMYNLSIKFLDFLKFLPDSGR
tara:strand:- start:759 stop:1334 length:576 start_codon:yes stop_codon:yes gene_type:complete